MSQQIDLIKFLFFADVDIVQAEYILDNFPNFSMSSYDEFYNFFKTNGIKLQRYKQTTTDERLTLLEKFQGIKQSYEYEILKKYIQEERNLELLLSATDPKIMQVGINSISKFKLDALDYYIVRKVLTGSENGVLPSEKLKRELENLIQINPDVYAENKDLPRDDVSRLISYQNIFRNEGRIKVPIFDDRYKKDRFDYVVRRAFSTLADAVGAEKNVAAKMASILQNPTSVQQFLSDLENLKINAPNTTAGLEAKIARLEEIIVAKQELIDSMVDKEIEHEAFIDSIAIDNIQKEQELEDKGQTITQLQNTVDTKLKEISDDVTKQITNITSAFDTLSQTVVGQANTANSAQDKIIEEQKKKIEILEQEKEDLEKELAELIATLKGKGVI